MKNITDILFPILRNALFEKELDDDTKKEASENAKVLYEIARQHDYAHLLAYSFEKCGIAVEDAELKKKIKKKHLVSVIRYERISYELERMKQAFEENGIAFLPLKGTVIRELYPEPWMRTSCDIDVLVKEEELGKAINVLVEELGFELKEKGTHDVSLFSQNGTHIEIHYKLYEDFYESSSNELLKDVWSYANKKSGSNYCYEMTDELFYFYHIYHMAKHFEVGGCGIRPFLDLWLLNNRVEADAEKRNVLLEKGGLKKFADCCVRLSEYWFADGEPSDVVLNLQSYILRGGVYGNRQNYVALNQAKSGGKLQHILNRLILPYNLLKVHYPILEKHKYLTPVFQVLRWMRLLTPKTFKRAKQEIKIGAAVSDNRSGMVSELFDELGLNT